MCTYLILSYYVFILCQSGTSWYQVVNSLFLFFTHLAPTFNFLFQIFFLKLVCTNCLVLSCHYDAFCFFFFLLLLLHHSAFWNFFSDHFSKICVIESLFYTDSRSDFHFYPLRQVFTQNRSLCFKVVINLSTNTETTFHRRNKMFLVNTCWICSKELS
jgi:hypothetical protein